MITLEGVSKQYGTVPALDSVSLEVPEGGIFGIIGKSGAGKSTLLRIMSLLERPDRGEVRYRGERVDGLEGAALLARRRRMGMIFQNFNLMASRNAAQNIAYPLEIAGLSRKETGRRVDELLEMTGIPDKRRARLRELSGGQKQRVAIARALAANPELLFCDEATSALDPQTTRSILALIRDLQGNLGLTVIMVTHQIEVIRQICRDVAVMEKGRVVETGSAESVLDSPSSEAAKELLHE